MIANYGYKDGSGDFFISIDTDKCMGCKEKPCLVACPAGLLDRFVDDYDDEVVGIKESHRKKIKYSCAACKSAADNRNLACQSACKLDAIAHSW